MFIYLTLLFSCVKGINLDCAIKGKGDLVKAAVQSDLSAVMELITQGHNINETDEDGWTAIMFAKQKGHKEVIHLLIDADAAISLATPSGQAPAFKDFVAF